MADPATAQMAKRVDRLERRSRNQADRLAAARADADNARVAVRNARSELEQLEAGVSSLAHEGPGSPTAPWAYAGWLVAGALALLALRRRSCPPRPAHVVGWHPSDEELREFLSSESRNPR